MLFKINTGNLFVFTPAKSLFLHAVRLNWIPKGGGRASNKWSLARRGPTFPSYGRAKGAQQRPGLDRGGEHVPVAEPPIPSHDFTPPGRAAGPQNHELFHRQHPPAGLRLQEGAELPRPEPDAGQGEREPAGSEAAARRQPLPGLQLQQRQHLVVALLLFLLVVVVHVLVAFVQAELVETGRSGEQRDWQIRRQPLVNYGYEWQQWRLSAHHERKPADVVARLGLLYTVLGPAVIW